MAVSMKITVVGGVTPCRLVDRYRCFGGMYYLHLQGKYIQVRTFIS
jgi:hypothetical protein